MLIRCCTPAILQFILQSCFSIVSTFSQDHVGHGLLLVTPSYHCLPNNRNASVPSRLCCFCVVSLWCSPSFVERCWKSWKGLQSNPVQSMQSVCHLLHLFHAIFLSLFIGSVFPFVSATCKWTHIFQLTLSHWKPVPRILICQMKTGTCTGATRYFWRLSSQELSTVWLWQTATKHLILFHQHASARCHERIFRRISS